MSNTESDLPPRRNDLVRTQINDEEIVGSVKQIEEPQAGTKLITISPFGDREAIRVAEHLVEVADT